MAFSYYRTITIDRTKVPNTDRTNFPVLISGTYTYLKTVGNGGLVQNANGYDVGFYSDSALTTKLAWETEIYTASTGEVVYWVKVPTVSTSVDTVIYMAYGDTSISTDQSDKTNVWDSDNKAVWHFGNGTTLSGLDSTSNANDLTAVNTPTAQAGKIDGAAGLVSASSQYLSKTSNSTLQMGDIDFEISCWVYFTSVGSNQMIWAKAANSASDEYFLYHTNSRFEFWIQQGGTTYKALGTTFGSPSTATWYHIRVRHNATANTMGISVNDGAWDETSITGGTNTHTSAFLVGAYNAALLLPLNGRIDEMRIMKTLRSSDWRTTEYNNQNSPSTFYTVGPETPTVSPVNNTMFLMF